jgi:hypothetical protein
MKIIKVRDKNRKGRKRSKKEIECEKLLNWYLTKNYNTIKEIIKKEIFDTICFGDYVNINRS